MLRTVEGDLFAMIDEFDAVGHGCNTAGVWGAGIAVGFRDRFPGQYEAYREDCRLGYATPGGIYRPARIWGRPVYCLYTQDRPGRRARLEWVDSAVREMCADMLFMGYDSVLLPAIGCGIGGLKFHDVRQILSYHAESTGVGITVCLLSRPALVA